MFKKISVIGGGGYVGTVLVKELLDLGYYVKVIDFFLYGNFLNKHPNLNIIKDDIRNVCNLESYLKNEEVIIHLACISNDPSFELNPELGKQINYNCFEPLVKMSKYLGIKRFIYASSSSVYGVKKETDVTENTTLEPITGYSTYKAMCEDILLRYFDKNFEIVILRPATVCGYSPRQRLDVIVNLMTNFAYYKKIIKVFGGSQLRPNIHIKDMVELYINLLNQPGELINGEIFNVGTDNLTVKEIAEVVRSVINSNLDIEILPTNDLRSYHINSTKIKNFLKFSPKKSISDAVKDLKIAFENNLIYNSFENPDYHNIKKINSIKFI
jgi:nucleoside-diphosphate-sugar epimerase